jgi:hypothetical protein
MDLVKILEKKSKTSHSDRIGHIEGDVMQNHDKKKTRFLWAKQTIF